MSDNQFKPAWWLANSHLQTLWPALLRKRRHESLKLERERFELPDGDFLDLDWVGKDKSGPIVIIVPGFEGSIDSHYAKGMMSTIEKNNWRSVFMHFRGCSGEPNRMQRGYHSGETSDFDALVKELKSREPDTEIAAIGYSLGGNILLKWLGESGKSCQLNAAIAISVPFELHKAAERVQVGFSRFYQWYLLKCVRDRLIDKFRYITPVVDESLLKKAKTIWEFDNTYTAPVHGFSCAIEYYHVSSSRQYLKSIQVPTLILHAKDDPFMTESVIPGQNELSEHVKLELSDRGGHVGFVSGKFPWSPEYWLEKRVPDFLHHYF